MRLSMRLSRFNEVLMCETHFLLNVSGCKGVHATCEKRFFNTILLACLPAEMYVGQVGLVTGWGTLKEDGKPSCILQEVEVPVLSNEHCISNTNYTSKMITDNMLCAGYPGVGARDSCQGDSGMISCGTGFGAKRDHS